MLQIFAAVLARVVHGGLVGSVYAGIRGVHLTSGDEAWHGEGGAMLFIPVVYCIMLGQPVIQVTGAGSSNDQAQAAVTKDSARAAGTAGTSAAGRAVPEALNTIYRIGPEDVLMINVWKEPDLTVTVPVRSDGMISLPLLSDVQAAGLTPAELQENLTEKIKKFVNKPSVTVIVSQTNSRKAYVMGMVNRQGTIRLLSNLTVLQALSAAGGLAPLASSHKIYVLRSEDGQQRKLPFDYDAVLKGKHPEQNVVLRPGDTIVVP